MNKSPKESPRQIIDALLVRFNENPRQAYNELISSGIYFSSPHSEVFWKSFVEEQDIFKRYERFPEATDVFNDMVWLKFFHDHNLFYQAEKQHRCEAIIALNPSIETLTKNLFLCLEIGEIYPTSPDFPDFTVEALEAVKIILQKIEPLLKKEGQGIHSPALFDHCNMLIKVQRDIQLLEDFLDLFVYAGFTMHPPENGSGFLLTLPKGTDKNRHRYILNELKSQVKREFEYNSSQKKISEEQHFVKHDKFFKTDEGLATVFYNHGLTVTSQNKGTTAIQLDDSCFGDPEKDSPEEVERKNIKVLLKAMEQNFHYQLRHALARMYFPNDEVDPHTVQVLIKRGLKITLYDLLCAMSCLVAKADAARYLGDFPKGSIRALIRDMQWRMAQKQREMNPEEISKAVVSQIVHHLLEVEEKHCRQAFYMLTAETVVGLLRMVEELKEKSSEELCSIVELLAGKNTRLPFQPLYRVNGHYYFSYRTCNKFDMNRMLYDHYVSEKVFSAHGKRKEDIAPMQEAQSNRENHFNQSLAALFKPFTIYTGASVEFGGPTCDFVPNFPSGDIDAVAYFEQENTIIAIQVKLSNVTPRTEKRKIEWVEKRIIQKGVEQVCKDQTLLHSTEGLKLLAKKLGMEKPITNPRVYSLIVTDNFFVDHCRFSYNDQNEEVLCVSYFELKQLLCGEKIHAAQSNLSSFISDNPASGLIHALEQNMFWNFLEPIAEKFALTKCLLAISEDARIELRV